MVVHVAVHRATTRLFYTIPSKFYRGSFKDLSEYLDIRHDFSSSDTHYMGGGEGTGQEVGKQETSFKASFIRSIYFPEGSSIKKT